MAKPARVFVAAGVEAPITAYPCIACHGEDGTGKREGGVTTADIRPATLAMTRLPSGVSGRRPAYTEQTLIAAISKGVDASGNTLHPLMPRYALVESDMQNLLAYLKRLGSEPIAGVSEDGIRIGMLVPERGALARPAAQAKALLEAFFARINDLGGIYGRKLRLETWAYDADRAAMSAEVLRPRAAKDPPFCFLANVVLDAHKATFSFLTSDDAVSLAPLSLPGASDKSGEGNTFYVFAGLYDQARVLVDYVVDDAKLGVEPIALLHTDDARMRGAAKGAREQADLRGLTFVLDSIASRELAPDLARAIKRRRIAKIAYFGSGPVLEALARELRVLNWSVGVFGSAESLGAAALALPADPVTQLTLAASVAVAASYDDQPTDYQELITAAKLPREASAFQITAFAGAKLLEETLRRTGRGLTRSSFLRHLKATKDFRTGVSPLLTFGETRRAGSGSAMILVLDPATRRLSAATNFREPR